MNKTNLLSAILVIVFMVSCFTFFSASATEDDVENPSESVSVTEEITTTEPTTQAETTITTTTTTTTVAIPNVVIPNERTTAATAADPIYTTNATAEEKSTTAAHGVVTAGQAQTKETKEIQTTEEITEPTSAAKNIVDYGSKYRPIKWLSLVVMIACVGGLIAVNVRYRKKYGKPSGKGKGGKSNQKKKPQLDTSARFTPLPEEKAPADENLDKTAVVDLSSFSKKPREEEFKPKLVDDDFFGEKKRKDEDNLFSNKKNDDDDLYI